MTWRHCGPMVTCGSATVTIEPLWTIADIQLYLRVQRSQACAIASSSAFPRAVMVTAKSRRWIPSEVVAWAKSRR
jgi:predicted DNA-binding transcriptional regulator AlpA